MSNERPGYNKPPLHKPVCHCPPRERIPNGDDPTRCYRCGGDIGTQRVRRV
jgi:hypothetical protein